MGIRQLIPASSRSFWQLFDEVVSLRSEVQSLRSELNTHDSQVKMMSWEAMRRGGESLDDTKKRFFKEMPKATGGLRLLQLGNAKLLEEFDALCAEHEIPYWIAFGTLLGAVRHGGFIPWDDDTDLGMMRQDIERLMDLVKDSDRYRVTVVYDFWAHCKQVRFRYADENIPCFLDLFIFDYTTEYTSELFETMNALRGEMIDGMNAALELASWNASNPFVTVGDSAGAAVAQYFENAYDRQHQLMPELTADAERAQGILWGIDNVYDFNKYKWVCKLEDIFPLGRIEFEGITCNAPANFMKFVTEVYGDYLSLPLVSNTYEHAPIAFLENAETQAAIRGFLDELP